MDFFLWNCKINPNSSFLAFLHNNNFETKAAPYEKWRYCIFDDEIDKISERLKTFISRCHRQFAFFGFNRETSVVQSETNAIYGICAFFHLFPEETNAGLQGTAIYFALKDSLYENPEGI